MPKRRATTAIATAALRVRVFIGTSYDVRWIDVLRSRDSHADLTGCRRPPQRACTHCIAISSLFCLGADSGRSPRTQWADDDVLLRCGEESDRGVDHAL